MFTLFYYFSHNKRMRPWWCSLTTRKQKKPIWDDTDFSLYSQAQKGCEAVVVWEEDEVADESEFVLSASSLLSSPLRLPSEFRGPVGDLLLFCRLCCCSCCEPNSDGRDATGAYTLFDGAPVVSTAGCAAAAAAVNSGGGIHMPPTRTIWGCWGLLAPLLCTAGVFDLLVYSRYFWDNEHHW